MAAQLGLAIRSAWRIDPKDDVAVALRPIARQERVVVGEIVIVALDSIPSGHKLALRPIAAGEQVRKYGCPIGRARQAIACGAHVHAHNLATELAGVQEYRANPTAARASVQADREPASFKGYRRASGRAVLTGVLRYGESVTRPGLSLLESPGNDAISATALVAAGANVLLFTTGRGTPLGFPVPTLKISSNSALAATKPHWIDFDAGTVLDGVEPQQLADELLELVLATASGRPARNELNDEREIAIWKGGVTL